jgi:alkyl sulfatase BDS1-like metallo-beta-lactamase superfamily hydrolase
VSDLPFEDRSDFDDADRGLIGSLQPCVVKDASGRVVWDNDAFAYLDGDCPDTAHPSLWRQAQLCARQGLYEVTDGIYQIRGLDLSNMTLVEGERGVIVIDPLISTETAAAGLALYRQHRGERPVTGVIYTHSHVDHFGGVRGVVTADVPILAPAGLMEHAVAENVYAGGAMNRRALYMYGVLLNRAPDGQIGAGLGMTTSSGTVSLIPPTVDVTRTGQQETIDGTVIEFQLTPGTEAPAEMNFYLPGHRALCLAENATHNLHNILTLRGALVRDPRVWSRYLNEAIGLFAGRSDVAFASHHWPTWGTDRVVAFLTQQRDLYAYLHDQTLRMMNQGYTGIEIAERIEMPPALERAWHTHGYYGSVSHNVKAIYQRYMGWFDGNPAHLWGHPPAETARRYVECIGGLDAVLAKARGYAEAGDLRFAAELLNHAVFADPANTEPASTVSATTVSATTVSATTGAKELLAAVYDRLGHGAENGTWRNFYLMGALELRRGAQPPPVDLASMDMLRALSVEQLFDSLAIRVNGPRAWGEALTIDWDFTDEKARYRMVLSNGALIHWPDPGPGDADLTLTLTRPALLAVLGGGGLAGVQTAGDTGVIQRLLGLLDRADQAFPIVTP